MGNKLCKNIIGALTLSCSIEGKKPDRSCFCRYSVSCWGGGVCGSGRTGGCGVIQGHYGPGLGKKNITRHLLMAGKPLLRIPMIYYCFAIFFWSNKILVCGYIIGWSSVRECKRVGSYVE